MTMEKLRRSTNLLLVALIALAAALTASAQEAVPMMINYSGELRDSTTGDPVPDGSHDMRFRIYDVETGGTHLWEEVHSTLNANPVEVTDGVFSVLLGSGTGDALSASVFSGPDRWLEIMVETETMSPRQRIASSAYSIVSEDSRLLDGKEAADFAEAVHGHSGSDITAGTVAEGRIHASLARDSEVDAQITTHASNSSAHHAKTTSFSELTDTASDAQIPTAIARDSELSDDIATHAATAGAHHAKTTSFTELTDTASDAQIPTAIARDSEVTSEIATHTAVAGAHHAKTTTFAELTDTATDGQVPASIARDSEIMPTVLAADGTGSTLDADRLDGKDSAEFADAGHHHSGADITSGTVDETRIDSSIARDTEVDSEIASHAGVSNAHHAKTTSFLELTNAATDAQIPDNITIDYAASAGEADTVDGMQGAALEESAEIDADIASHAAVAGAHHAKTTSFSELTDTANDAQIPNNITINYSASAGDADTVDGMQGAALEESAEIDADIAFHAAVAGAHHAKTTSFSELTDTATDAQIPNNITVNYAASAGEADFLDGIDSSDFWQLGGNSGTSPGGEFLGTVDNTALEIKVNSNRALRIEPGTTPNLIAGHPDNWAETAVIGAAIGGGGEQGSTSPLEGPNRVLDDYGTVGGGKDNQAGNDDDITSTASYSTVGGGRRNKATEYHATVGGGEENESRSYGATVAGGHANKATYSYSSIGGGYENEANGECAAVAGGAHNVVNASYGTIAGGGPGLYVFPITTNNRVTDEYGTIGGGGNNSAGDESGTDDDAPYATVGGGSSNRAHAAYATIGGGGPTDLNDIENTNNRVLDNYGTIGGGGYNRAGNGTGTKTDAYFATVAGGRGNEALHQYSTICGGYMNVAGGYVSTVGGGARNEARGECATVPGGRSCEAAHDYTFAAGRRAKANQQGSFVWADSQDADVASTGANQFVVRANGGVWFGTTSSPSMPFGRFINTSVDAYCSIAGNWVNSSDRNKKENFQPLDGEEILRRLSEMPISSWNYKAEDPSVLHIGPVAQDFHAAFGLGNDDKHIGTGDADGVALAAIQGLHEIVQEKDARISSLEARIEALESLVEKLVECQTRGDE